MPKLIKSDTKLFIILFILCLVPVLSGGVRMFSLATSGPADPENLNYITNPTPIIAHMLAYMLFCVFGTLQIAPRFRSRHTTFHRITGRLLIPIGILAAATGIWMSLTYEPQITNGQTVAYVRIFFGAGMILSLLLGTCAIRRRNIAQHQIWMLRSYAIALGASTQALVAIPWIALLGEPQGPPWAIAMFLTWMFNLAVAECTVRGQQ